MKKLVSIKHYPSNFEIAYEENDETTVHSLSYDGLKGELTRADWKEDSFIADFDETDQEKILEYMYICLLFADEEEEELSFLDYMNIYEIFEDLNKELSLAEIADNEGLKYVESTSGINGYPKNIQDAIVGFDNWEQLEKVAKKYNLNAINLHKRDGWQLYERQGIPTEPYKNSCNDYGDDYSECYDADAYQKQVMEDAFPYLEFSTFEDIEKWLKEKKEVYEELLTCGENEIVITNQGRFYEKINETSMEFSHDTHNYIIGLQK